MTKTKKKFLFAFIALSLVTFGSVIYFQFLQKTSNASFDISEVEKFVEEKTNEDVFGQFAHPVKAEDYGKTFRARGFIYNFYFYSDIMPDQGSKGIDTRNFLNEAIMKQDWKSIQPDSTANYLTFDNGIAKYGYESGAHSTGSYTNQFYKGNSILILSAETILEEQGKLDYKPVYLKKDGKYLWNVRIIRIDN